MPGRRTQHGVHGNDVAAREHGCEVIALRNASARHRVAIDVRIEAKDLHPESLPCHARDGRADPADADEPQRLAREIRSQPARRGPRPAAFPHFALQRFQLAREREHQCNRAFGDGFLRVFGNVDDGNAPRPCSDDVDRIDAHAVLDDAAQSRSTRDRC